LDRSRSLTSSYSSRFGRQPGFDNIDKLNNWGEFQNLLDDIKEQKAQYRIDARKARVNKQWIEPSPFTSYPAEAMENLAEIVGLRNRGIKFTPDLNSANTAQMWLNKKKAMAQSDAVLAELNKYKVEEADLDNNPNTRDNVIVYSDRELGKIYSIDGYQLTSGQKKMNQRNIYSAFPIKEVRSDVVNSAHKTDLKAWLRKYPTPQRQRNHPFETFVREKSAFEILKNEIKDFLVEYGISMHTKANQQGNRSVHSQRSRVSNKSFFVSSDRWSCIFFYLKYLRVHFSHQ
jgi:acyl-CoA synthetase (NDP forming)